MNNLPFAKLAAPAAVVLAFGLGACEQPKMLCNTGHGAYSVRYTLVSGSGPCATLKTGLVGVQAYGTIGKNGNPNWRRPPVALKMDEVGALVDAYGVALGPEMTSSVARFAAENPGADGFCPVEALSPVSVQLAAVPAMPDGMGGMTEPLPATSLSLQWSNVKFYVTPSVIGGEFMGDLSYTKDGCTATYKVSGLYPSVSCEDEEALGGINPGLCLPCKGGAGISPAVETVCDPESKLCLPKTEVPSLRTTPLMCPAPKPQPAPPKPDAGSPDAGTPDAGSPDAAGDTNGTDGGADALDAAAG